MAIRQTADDYKKQLIALAPRGPCWPLDDGSTWIILLEALAQEFYRTDDNCNDLIEEAFPDTTDILLENWEEMTGLPDECEISGATEAQRRAAVLAKVRARGGQSAYYYESIILALGFNSTVCDCVPFLSDEGEAGEYCFDASWDNKFVVTLTDTVSDQTSLECSINKIKPAHAQGFFNYL